MIYNCTSAWSFGKKARGILELKLVSNNRRSVTPGPGAYTPNSVFNNQPVIKMVSNKSQSRNAKYGIPGVGEYSIPNKIGEGPKYSIGDRGDYPNSNKAFISPGPIYYSDPGKKYKSVSYSISARPKTTSYISPGPGDYNLTSDQSLKKPSFIFGNDIRDQSHNNLKNKVNIPGPGAYSIEDYKPGKTAPKFSFEKVPKGTEFGCDNPGPDKYHHKVFFGEEGVKATMMSRPGISKTKKRMKQTPGPAEYKINERNKPNAPSFRMVTTSRERIEPSNKHQISNPGPVNYNTINSFYNVSNKAPNWSLGSAPKKGKLSGETIPGPNNFMTCKDMGQGLKFSISGKFQHSIATNLNNPGPGEYNTNIVSNLKSQPSWKMPLSSRDNTTKILNRPVFPGPSDYDYSQKKPSGGFSFPKQNRNVVNHTVTPGAAHYRIPCSMINVVGHESTPAFEMKYKYV